MNLINIRRSPDPDPATGSTVAATQPAATPQETAEQKAARLEAELIAEKKKVSDQNSYITRLEASRKTQTPAPSAQTVQGSTSQPSAAEQYATRKATEEAVEEAIAKSKEILGEEAAAEIAEEVRKIAVANIKDPFNIPKDMNEKIVQAALGKAMTSNPEKRVKIAGAYAKQPVTQTPPTGQPAVPPTVVAPASQKIGTIQPTDVQPGLGPTVPTAAETLNKPVSPKTFFANIKKK